MIRLSNRCAHSRRAVKFTLDRLKSDNKEAYNLEISGVGNWGDWDAKIVQIQELMEKSLRTNLLLGKGGEAYTVMCIFQELEKENCGSLIADRLSLQLAWSDEDDESTLAWFKKVVQFYVDTVASKVRHHSKVDGPDDAGDKPIESISKNPSYILYNHILHGFRFLIADCPTGVHALDDKGD